MALYLNVSPSTIYKWESGTVKPENAALKLLNLAYQRGLDAIK
jgi:DNA-binding transcriptional regulator YiaG